LKLQVTLIEVENLNNENGKVNPKEGFLVVVNQKYQILIFKVKIFTNPK